jgi:hypothetical protein
MSPKFYLLLPVLLAIPTSVAASPPLAERLTHVLRTAQSTGSRAARQAMDEAAEYWFAPDRKAGRDLAGTGPALAVAIRLARAEALRSGVKRLPRELKRRFRQHYSGHVLATAGL